MATLRICIAGKIEFGKPDISVAGITMNVAEEQNAHDLPEALPLGQG